MSKRSKRWAAAILVLLVLLPPMAVVVAGRLIDPDAYKARIEAVVQQQTGRALTIDGPIRLGWAIQPTITLTGAHLANLPGGSRPDFATVERIEARLSLPALLHRRIAIDRLTLIGPNILFEPVSGRPNWVFQAPKPETGTSEKRGLGLSLTVRTAHIQNGMVTFRFPDRTNVIGLRTLDYQHRQWTDPLRIDAVLVYRDYQPFTFHVESTPTGGTFDPLTSKLDAQAFDATLHATGTTSLAGPYDLALSLHAPKLERLNELLPSMRLPALHAMDLSTHLASPSIEALPTPGQTSLRAASVNLGERLPGLSLADFRVDLPRKDGIATLAANGLYRTQPFRFSGTIDMPARFDGRSTEAISLDAVTERRKTGGKDDDRFNVRGTLALNDGAFAGFDGAVKLRTESLAAFRPISSPALPDLTELSLESGLSLPASLDRITLSHIAAHAAEGDLDGEARLRLSAIPDGSATLHSQRLILDPLLPRSADPAAPRMDAALPWDALKRGALDVSWRADHVIYRKQDWPDLRVHATLRQNRMALDMPGGLLSGHATVDATALPGPVPVTLAIRSDAFPLQPLTGLAGVPDRLNESVEGILRMSLDLSARGNTPRALIDTLSGSIGMSTANAGMSDDALSILAAPALKQLGSRPSPGNHTTVRCFGVRGTALNGLFKLSTIAVDAGNLVLSGNGTVDLAHDAITLKLKPLARLAGSRVSVPVVVKGSLSAPSATLDAGGLDKVGLLLDALFGGDHPKTCRDAGLVP